jgi:hypothetical protein
VKVSRRARRHADRGGDPLDGLVNLFDLGIVLAVAFLLAALSSLDLTDVLTDEEAAARAAQAAQITATESETVEELELEPGERVVGQGREIGRVYELEDGRTVIVREGEDGTSQTEEIDPVAPDAETAPEPDSAPAPDAEGLPNLEDLAPDPGG